MIRQCGHSDVMGQTCGGCYTDLLNQNSSLLRENERLSGKTGCCMQCEAYAKENEELKLTAKNRTEIMDANVLHCNKLEHVADIAKTIAYDYDVMLGLVYKDGSDRGTYGLRLEAFQEALRALRGKP